MNKWFCLANDCHNIEEITWEEYQKIREEYGEFLCSSCREKQDNKKVNEVIEKLKDEDFRFDTAKKLSEPKAEFTLDLHYLATRNEELLKELDEKNNIIKIQSMNNRVLLEEIMRLRENKNAK